MKISSLCLFSIVILLLFRSFSLSAEDRFPRPEFQSNYELPETTTPQPRNTFYEYLDSGVLLLMLILTAFFALYLRSRTGIFFCSLFSLLYFGFWKQGCVCSIGSIQNISYALFSGAYTIPITVAIFFSLPLLFTLLFGRVFCGGVCPFGALQDLVALKPITLPLWLEKILSLIPPLYLGAAILFAATGSGFIICRLDPFVGFFRFGATFGMFAFGGIILLVGVFVARPYCRFICPYGVLLSWASRLSQWHIKITRGECVRCRLCENICPVDAIQKPSPVLKVEKNKTGVRRLIIFFLLLPLVMAGTGLLFSGVSHIFARMHPDVRLAEQLIKENNGEAENTTEESDAFRGTGISFATLVDEVKLINSRFYVGTWLLGLYAGLIIMLTLIQVSLFRKRTSYTIEQGSCVNCGRCLSVCPVEHEQKKKEITR